MEAVVVALITGGCTALASIVSSVLSAKSSKSVINERISFINEKIETLSDRVDKHNNLVERMAKAESSIKSAHHRLDELN